MAVCYSVTLAKPYNDKTEYVFGSIAAIFEVLPPKVLGISAEQTIYNLGIGSKGHTYTNDHCTIRQHTFYRKKTNRGMKAKDQKRIIPANCGKTLTPDKYQVVNVRKTKRNEPCPCGSGKKFKKCCLEDDKI